ncbi:MAG TPA: MarR family transcriptional regulator [Solirubrobacter sp.]|nr:MarR family transcriptional regulator [Solirubrobacter sp.]
MSASESTLVLLIRLSKAVHRSATDEVLGVRLKDYVTLALLRNGARAQAELCAAVGMDPNNCVLLLNHLEAAGHVERKRDPADRRRHIVELTPAGRKALDRAERGIESLEDEVLGALTLDEREQLRSLLIRALTAEPVTA